VDSSIGGKGNCCGERGIVEDPATGEYDIMVNNPENTNTIMIAVCSGTRLFLTYL
jgi:hypothetical protein